MQKPAFINPYKIKNENPAFITPQSQPVFEYWKEKYYY